MNEKENKKNVSDSVGITEKRCSGCQRPESQCICIEGYHTLNNRMAYKKATYRGRDRRTVFGNVWCL